MAYTDPTTVHVPAAGDIAPASWGTVVNTNLNWLHDVPVCCLKKTGVQSVNDSSDTLVTWESEEYDPEGMFTSTDSTTRITVPYTGAYLVVANMLFAADADGFRYVRIYLNGVIKAQEFQPGNGTGGNHFGTTVIYPATAGQYFEVSVEHSAGAALNIGGASNYQSNFSVTLIRET